MDPPPRQTPAHPAATPDTTRPLAPPLVLTSVWQCADLPQAEAAMSGQDYVYQRERHPNADALAAELAGWHAAPRAAMTSSGMAALALAAVSQLRSGDHVVMSDQLYGKTQVLWGGELERFGVRSTTVDILRLDEVRAALTPDTRLLLTETIANPMLRVADLAALAELAHDRNAHLLVDNTFASPWLCRPLEWGADWVMESISKMINGHSDVMLGALLGPQAGWERVTQALTAWGWSAAPLQCWLAQRGLATLDVRMERACRNALELAAMLQSQPLVREVIYPGLPEHPDHALADRQFGGRFGSMLTLRLECDVERFLSECGACSLPFAPSLGETHTTLSHPASTSHRGLSEAQRRKLGIDRQVVRVSVGIEPLEELCGRFQELLGRSAGGD